MYNSALVIHERGNDDGRESFPFSASRSGETRKPNSDSQSWEKLVAFDRRDSQSTELEEKKGKKENGRLLGDVLEKTAANSSGSI